MELITSFIPNRRNGMDLQSKRIIRGSQTHAHMNILKMKGLAMYHGSQTLKP